jgi:uncharacterized protein with von Willebrand factor type A (vWA) domain
VQKKIIEFTNLLRKSGVRVSVAESIDAFAALDELSLEDREIFQDALRTTMVKRSEDIPSFDELFHLFWSGFHDQLRETLANALGGVGGPVDLDQLIERLREILEQMQDSDLDMSDLATALLTADLTQLENLIRQAAQQAGVGRIENMLQIGFFSRRTLEQLDAEGAGAQLEELARRLAAQGLSDEEAAALMDLVRALREALRQAVRQFSERELQQQNHDYIEKFRRETLLEKSFYNLTEEDIRRMGEVVARLAQKIKNILTVRRKREKRGKFDLHQTLRRNMGHGGVPFELIFKQRRKDRPKPAGGLHEDPQLRLRRRAGGGDRRLRAARHPRGHRPRAGGRRRDQCLHAIQLRVRLPLLLAELPVRDRLADHGAGARGRAQQLQRPARVVSARHAQQGEERGLAQPGEPRSLGLRGQCDGPLPAVLRCRRGVPEPAPAVACRRSPRALERPAPRRDPPATPTLAQRKRPAGVVPAGRDRRRAVDGLWGVRGWTFL